MTINELMEGASVSNQKCIVLYEKEKGGVGSTGTMMTHAHGLMLLGHPVVLVEASTTQQDIAVAYNHLEVKSVDLRESYAAAERLIDIVTAAPNDAYILVNVPGGAIEQLDEVHQIMLGAKEIGFDAEVKIVWTVGLDAASVMTLEAIAENDLPGRLFYNLPQWADTTEALIAHLGDQLIATLDGIGATELVTPAMPPALYNIFRSQQISPDRFRGLSDFSVGKQAVLHAWEMKAKAAVKGII
jgi:hypothetical protein